MPWMRHPDVDGEPVRVNDSQFELLYKARGWELTDRPLGFGETPTSLPSEPLGPPPAPVDPDAMTRDELVQVAKNRRVDVKASATKDEIAEAVNTAPTQPDTEA